MSQQDGVRNYSVAITYYGLLELCHRDAIREADGVAMMALWRSSTIRFWEGNNYKYMTTGHRLLSGRSMQGFAIVTLHSSGFGMHKFSIDIYFLFH